VTTAHEPHDSFRARQARRNCGGLSSAVSKGAAALIFAGLLTSSVCVAVDVSFLGSFGENFDSMGTGTTLPTGWTVYAISGNHDTIAPADSSVPGTSAFLPTGSLIAGGSVFAGAQIKDYLNDPSEVSSSTRAYNLGLSSSATDRSLGTSPTDIAGTVLELTLVNNTGSSITALNFAYDIRRFSTNNSANAGYDGSPYFGKEEFPGYWLFYSLDGGATYTNFTTLNPSEASVPGDSTGVSHFALTNFSLSGAWTAGSSLRLRWFDDNAQSSSPDQILGLDNVTIVTAIPEPANEAALLSALAFLAL